MVANRFQCLTALAFGTAAIALLLNSCGSTAPSTAKNIFGPDNRETLDVSQAPYSAIGRLDSGCTGTLIGRKLVLTAAHCVVDNATGTVKPELKYFRPAFANGLSREALWIDYAWIGTDKPEDDRTKDWAVLRLERPISDTYGNLAVQEVDFATSLPYTINMAGYSIDREQGNSAGVHRGCYVMAVSEGRLFHDCDGAAGVSGGPIFKIFNGVPHIIGLTVSEFRRGSPTSVTRDAYSSDYANVGIPATYFASAVRTLVQTIDVDIPAPHQDGVLERTNPNRREPVPSPTPNPEPTPKPWQNDFRQIDLVSRATLTQRGNDILEELEVLRTDATRFDALASQYHDRTLSDVAAHVRLATAEFARLVESVMNGAIEPNVGQNLFYNYRVLNEQEATLYEFTGWENREPLQQQIKIRQALFSQEMREFERLVFSRVAANGH